MKNTILNRGKSWPRLPLTLAYAVTAIFRKRHEMRKEYLKEKAAKEAAAAKAAAAKEAAKEAVKEEG